MPMLPNQKARAVARKDHPAAQVTKAFSNMRERCRYYRGIKESDAQRQCTHPDNRQPAPTNWCTMEDCPLLRERAAFENLGWD